MRLKEDPHQDQHVSVTARAIAVRLPAALARAWRLGWRADWRCVLLLLAGTLACALLTATALRATADLLAHLLGPGGSGRLQDAVPSLVVVTCATAGAYLADAGTRLAAARLAPQVHREADLAVITASTRAELGAYHDKAFDKARLAATEGAKKSGELVHGAQGFISATAQLTAAMIVVAALNALLLPVMLLAVVPRVWGAVRAARIQHATAHRNHADSRLRGVLAQYATDGSTAPEVRACTMGGFLLEQYRATSRRLEAEQYTGARRSAFAQGAGDLLAAVATTAVWACIAVLMVNGHMSVAAAATTVLAVRTANAALTGSVRASASLFTTGLYVTDWAAFMDSAPQWSMNRGAHAAPAGGPDVIEAKSLTFTYPRSTTPAVDHVDLTIRRGEVIALIGENGSGKSTLARLLTGLILPTSGTVTWDAQPTTGLDPHSLWQTIAAVPQDYTRWSFTARQNITLGRPRPDGDHAVHEAARNAGADTVLATLPDGLNTSLARSWWGGTDLSGGQWQRLAIARGFHRDAPVIVMDEPTSALDARAEHQLFTRLRTLAHGRAATIFITHRLANAAIADRIIVLHNGHIVESGTYRELLAGGGRFAELKNLQDRRTDDTPATAGVGPR